MGECGKLSSVLMNGSLERERRVVSVKVDCQQRQQK